ncbi:MAG: carboxypeptidase regulatory-like domain-containing protein, partial [Verrucomicrobiae bacterium]|nr:carboxypeptidase regulatory-like domain-containing protein [Verrucomicrobiae bacterium]
MADLIDQNPRRALELAVPVAVRRGLPSEILELLEEPVSGRGDLSVMALVAAPGRTLDVRPVQRSVKMEDGREYETFTYGLREQVPTRADIAIQGIAVDGKLALTELPGRILEPVEVAELNSDNEVCPTSGVATSTTGEEVVVDWDGSETTFFCGPNHALDELMIAAFGNASIGGDGTAPSARTEGTKTMLIIRVDFPDFQSQVVSDATLTTLIDNMATHWSEMSYDKTTWATVGNGSAFTPTLRLPNGHASYKSFGTMLNAARAAATAAGYDYQDYTHEVVVSGSKPDVSFGGVAFVGARGAWLAKSQWNLGVCSHEVGHNFGLLHSGFWDTDDGTTIGSGSAVEYGNPFDHMGGASSSTNAHFGARQKNYLDWIADGDVVKITSDGSTTTRLRAFDKSAATNKKAIAVDRSGTTNDYWIEYRQTYASSKPWMKDGVVLNWGDVNISNMRPLLLDNAPATSTKDDCAVLIGRTFSDTAAGIHITPVLRGADADGTSWVDVTVDRGSFPGNQKPSVVVTASNLNPATNANVTFTAVGSDPDGDTLGYCWDWGDGSFTANNSPAATKSWSATGTKTVRCYVTDMKGQTTTGQLLVQVGSSSTYFIQGTVTTTIGAPVAGALVKADDTHTDSTDSEGYYAITGLDAGSYSVTATKTGLTIQPDSFTNPVTVGPNRQNINFTAPPGSPYFSSMKAGLVDAGSNTGAVIVPVKDADTPVTDLTLTATSSDQGLIPDTNIVFGTAGTTVRTVTATALANVGGPLTITITATDPQGGTGTYVWPVTVNAKPVLTTSTQNTPENTPIDIDLGNFVTDDLTPIGRIRFDVSRARNGSVT